MACIVCYGLSVTAHYGFLGNVKRCFFMKAWEKYGRTGANGLTQSAIKSISKIIR